MSKIKSIKIVLEIPDHTTAAILFHKSNFKALKSFIKYIRSKWHLPIEIEELEVVGDSVHVKFK
jgi:hypothetical protein